MRQIDARIMVAAGGTGGHLFPAMAVVEQLLERGFSRDQFIFVGTPDKIESRKVPAAGFRYETLPIRGLTSLRSISTLTLPFKILKSVQSCSSLIKKNDVRAVICAGAYISYPAGLAAARNNKLLYLMQADANPGKAVKALADKADRIFVSFEDSHRYFSEANRGKLMVSGNPVRRDFLSPPAKSAARRSLGLDTDRPVLFVFGGSLGARSINLAMQQHLHTLAEAGIQIIWQTGKTFDPAGLNVPQGVQVSEFIDDMATTYAAADLILARAGATTAAELTALGKPSILVPLPSATNDEQNENAKLLEAAGAARRIIDADIADALPRAITELLNAPEALAAMGAAAASLARPDAAQSIAKTIIDDLSH